MNDIHKRTKFLVETLGPNPNAFAVKTGIQVPMVHYAIGNRKRRSKPGYDFIYKVLTTFPQINPAWYILGQGIWNISSSKKNNIKFDNAIKQMNTELLRYKQLYGEEKFVNEALREKIGKWVSK